MSAQYLNLVVPALDLQDGDVIPFNQSTLTVQSARSTSFDTGPGESHAVVRVDSYGDSAVLYLHPDTMLNIQRPDPEAERIEQLCKVYYESLEGNSGNLWENSAPWYQDVARAAMRDVLAKIDNEGNQS